MGLKLNVYGYKTGEPVIFFIIEDYGKWFLIVMALYKLPNCIGALGENYIGVGQFSNTISENHNYQSCLHHEWHELLSMLNDLRVKISFS